MKTYSLNHISRVLNIPKSTLRYWESEGLIQSQRNKNNEYREYTTEDVLIISDIQFYRSLNFSVKDLKNLYGMGINQHTQAILKSRQELLEQIESLQKTLLKVDAQIDYFDTYYQANIGVYHHQEPDFDRIIHFHPLHTENAKVYFENQNLLSFSLQNGENKLDIMGITDNTNIPLENEAIIWEKNNNHFFTPIMLQVSELHLNSEPMKPLIANELNQGRDICGYVGRYLLSIEEVDYYLVWIESKD